MTVENPNSEKALREPASLVSLRKLQSRIKELLVHTPEPDISQVYTGTFRSSEEALTSGGYRSRVFEIHYQPYINSESSEDKEEKPEKFTIKMTRLADLTKVGLLIKDEAYSFTIYMVGEGGKPDEQDIALVKQESLNLTLFNMKPEFSDLTNEIFDIKFGIEKLPYSIESKDKITELDLKMLDRELDNPRHKAHEGMILGLLNNLQNVVPVLQ